MAGGTKRRERKVVTVVFCDLVGFTSQAETMDPEDVEAILRPYHERVRSELERHGGTVEKFIGDAVMAMFGAPTAHEDDPERAVRASLAIRDFALEEGLELRVGITTGEALVRLDASPEAGEGMASGDVVNTAARLQSGAPINGILVDDTTYRATRHVVEFDEPQTIEAKGKSAPIAVRRVLEARSRLGVDTTHHERTSLVGREHELAALRHAFERARQERTPQLVTLVAVPGMGKSRLIHELMKIVDADEQIVTWRQGRCLAYGDGIAFWALGEVVKAQAGVLDGDSDAEVATKLHVAVADVLAEGDADAAWIESHLRPLAGLAGDAASGDNRGEAFGAWRRFLEAIAAQRPLILVLEDLHWADEGLLDFVDELVDWVSGVPLLVVASARPELLEHRPGWSGGKLNATSLALAPLSPEQTSALIAQVLERAVLPAETQRLLLERADGNPLYAEQFAELYRELGSTADLELPETLQGLVAARVDGLPAGEKALLHDAAVVGKVFWSASLRRDESALAPFLQSLARKGFLTRQHRSSVEGQLEWSFAHMLLRDVAYGQIPRAERASKHRDTALWLESLGRLDDHAELLAFHWTSALELTRATGGDTAGLEESTRLALRAAGDRAAAVNAYAAAVAHYDGALELWPDDPERASLLFKRATALGYADDERMFEALEDARDALLAAGDRDTAAEAEASLSVGWWRHGDGKRARLHQRRAEELMRGSRSRAAARVLGVTARMLALHGDPDEALELGSHALELAEELDADEHRVHALDTMGLAKRALGDPSGDDDQARALAIALAAHLPTAGILLNNMAISAWLGFDMHRAAELFAEGERVSEQYGNVRASRVLQVQIANMAFVLGNWETARCRLAELFEHLEAGRRFFLAADVLRGRARFLEAGGDQDGALAGFREALVLARATTNPQQLLQHVGTAASVYEERGFEHEARELALEQLELARSSPHNALWALPYEFLLSRAALELADAFREVLTNAPHIRWSDLCRAALDRDFARAADLWAEAGSPTWEARYRLRAAEELAAEGRVHESEAQAARAAEFYRGVGASYFVQRAQRLFPETATA